MPWSWFLPMLRDWIEIRKGLNVDLRRIFDCSDPLSHSYPVKPHHIAEIGFMTIHTAVDGFGRFHNFVAMPVVPGPDIG